MQKTKGIITTILILIAVTVTAFTTITAHAIAPGFSVAPVIHENQSPNNTAYFDLTVIPGTRQDLSVEITNSSEQDATFEASLFAVGTNRNGIIDYTSPGLTDETLSHPFADIAHFPQGTTVFVSAGETVTLPVYADIPEEGFDGQILGAIRLLLDISDEQRAQSGMIVNRFAYITIVRLSVDNSAFAPDFALGDVGTQTVDHRASIVAQIRNPIPRVSANAVVSGQIYAFDRNEPFWTIENFNVEFAPNSIFELSFIDNEGFGITPGEYIARIQVLMDGNLWEFEQQFTVAAAQAQVINSGAVNQQSRVEEAIMPHMASQVPTWLVVTIIASIVFLLLLVIVLIIFFRKISRKRDQRELGTNYVKP